MQKQTFYIENIIYNNFLYMYGKGFFVLLLYFIVKQNMYETYDKECLFEQFHAHMVITQILKIYSHKTNHNKFLPKFC